VRCGMARDALFQVSAERRARHVRQISSRKILFQTFVVVLVGATCFIFWYAHQASLPRAGRGDSLTIQHDRAAPQLHGNEWECMDEASCINEEWYGRVKFAYGPSRGYFPRGCKWREVNFEDDRPISYEYWHSLKKEWTKEQPQDCILDVCPALCSWALPPRRTQASPIEVVAGSRHGFSLHATWSFNGTILKLGGEGSGGVQVSMRWVCTRCILPERSGSLVLA
jgi:hypothetical protein